jgi:putative acetyltransferase
MVQIHHCPPSPCSGGATETRDTSRSDGVIETRGGVAEAPGAAPQQTVPGTTPRKTAPDDVAVRAALPGDLAEIVTMVRAAFGYDLEARLIERLEREHRVAASVVAVSERHIVGHALLSRLSLTAPGRPARPALALAPVAVAPERQGCGIGELVVRGCLRRVDPALPAFVIGDPAFYARFGFEPAAAHGVTSRFDVATGYFMVRPGRCVADWPLAHDGPDGLGGRTLDYPAAFDGL